MGWSYYEHACREKEVERGLHSARDAREAKAAPSRARQAVGLARAQEAARADDGSRSSGQNNVCVSSEAQSKNREYSNGWSESRDSRETVWSHQAWRTAAGPRVQIHRCGRDNADENALERISKGAVFLF